MAMQQSNEKRACGMEGCGCSSTAFPGTEKGGRWYCSEGCSRGDGCTHSGCNCAKVGTVSAGEKANTASILGSTTKPVPKRAPSPDAR